MGTAHIVIHPEFMCRLIERYPKEIRVLKFEAIEVGLIRCKVQSRLLSAGYHGEAELSIKKGQLHFTLLNDLY